MNDSFQIRDILKKVKEGNLNIDDALIQLKYLPFEDELFLQEDKIAFARIDHHRPLRCGFPEVIFGLGKTPRQIVEITKSLLMKNCTVLITKTEEKVYREVKKIAPDAVYNKLAKTVAVKRFSPQKPKEDTYALIVSAGTTDISIAEEAAVTVDVFGFRVEKLYDVGVAGIHRLMKHKKKLVNAGAIVVVAGMEGALPSVVSGLVDVPVIAVPTSSGYGANLNGLSALLTMLNSCAPGLGVVNIDNGFGGGYFAVTILRMLAKERHLEQGKQSNFRGEA